VVGDYFIKLLLIGDSVMFRLLIGDSVMFRRQLYGGVGLSAQFPLVDNSVCAHNAPTTVSHKSSERDPGTASHHSLGKSKNRARRNNHAIHENNSCYADEKKYELDIERLLRWEDCRTTLIIKNIPNKYNTTMLLAAINEHNQGTYNFIYMSLDFKESSLMNEDKCCHPIMFTTYGPNAGREAEEIGETEIKGDDAYKEELLDYEEGDEKAPYVMLYNEIQQNESSKDDFATVFLKKPTDDLLLQVRRLVVKKDSKLTSFVENFLARSHICRLRPVVMEQQMRITFLTMVHISWCVTDVYIIIMNKQFIRRMTTKKKSISRAMEAIMVSCN
nr:protein MEI2-like 1 [Tanacetum cinerariifolium]